MVDALRQLKRRLIPGRDHSERSPVSVTFVYAPSLNFYETFRTHSLRFPLTRIPPRFFYSRAFRHFLPNNLLRSLKYQGDLHLQEHSLEEADRPWGAEHAARIPHADVWVFALLTDSTTPAFEASFFQAIRSRAEQENIRLLNLTTHIGIPRELQTHHPPDLPVLAKLKANGLTTPGDPDSYAILRTQEEIQIWKDGLPAERLHAYEIQPFLEHRRDAELAPFRCIERWICIGRDLTVGLRFSEDLIIKQLNSLTHYIRDPRGLAQEYSLLARFHRNRKRLKHQGPGHLSFGYSGSNEFWNRRHALYRALREATGFEIGSADVFEDKHGELHLIDYNEWTFESAQEDLASLWEAALLDAIHSFSTSRSERREKNGTH